MAKNKVKFYMQQYPINGVNQVVKDLEVDYPELYVRSLNGMNAQGKNKNLYFESFAEQSGVNAFIGVPYYETTNVTLVCNFAGINRQSCYDSFCSYVSGKKLYFWDSHYNKKVTIVLAEALDQPNEEKSGSNPNIEQTFKFTNINGTYTTV